MLRETIESGSINRARFALLALAPNSAQPEVAGLLAGIFRRPRHEGLDLLAAAALLRAEGELASAEVASVVFDPREDPLRRAAGALALGAVGFGARDESLEASIVEEKDPLVAGALALAAGLAGVESAIPSLEKRLEAAKEPPLRAGLFLGLASLGRRAAPSERDLLAEDPVLPWAAALHFPDAPPSEATSPAAIAWWQAIRSSTPSLRVSLFAALGRGSEDRSRAFLTEAAVTETDPAILAALYGSAAARGAMEILRTARRVEEDEASAFAAAAWMFETRSREVAPADRRFLDRAVGALSTGGEEAVEAAALLLGATRLREMEGTLAAAVRRVGVGGEAARLARKNLRGELDPRAFSRAVLRVCQRRGVLFESALADGAQRFAFALFGAESEYLGRRPELEGASRALHAWAGRRRSLPTDSPVYEDLGTLLERRPFAEVSVRRAGR
jgi:hypothetical protein